MRTENISLSKAPFTNFSISSLKILDYDICLMFIKTTKHGKIGHKTFNENAQCLESAAVRTRLNNHIAD